MGEEKRAKQTLPQGLPRGPGATRAGNAASQEGHRPVGGVTLAFLKGQEAGPRSAPGPLQPVATRSYFCWVQSPLIWRFPGTLT